MYHGPWLGDQLIGITGELQGNLWILKWNVIFNCLLILTLEPTLTLIIGKIGKPAK